MTRNKNWIWVLAICMTGSVNQSLLAQTDTTVAEGVAANAQVEQLDQEQQPIQCVEPELDIRIPDGAEATGDELLAAKRQIMAYIAQAEETLTCLDTKETAELDSLSLDERKALIVTYNRIAIEIRRLATDFNQQLERYNEKTFPAEAASADAS